MIEEIKKFIRDLLTEDDGVTWCAARVMSFMGIITYLGHSSYMLYQAKTIVLTDFATGFATLLAGAGALIAAKAATQKPK